MVIRPLLTWISLATDLVYEKSWKTAYGVIQEPANDVFWLATLFVFTASFTSRLYLTVFELFS